jgi:hypothetical protein
MALPPFISAIPNKTGSTAHKTVDPAMVESKIRAENQCTAPRFLANRVAVANRPSRKPDEGSGTAVIWISRLPLAEPVSRNARR